MLVLDREKLFQVISKRVNSDIDDGKLLGANVLVMQAGQTLVDASFGKKSEAEPLTKNTLFRMASMTKPITAVAVLILASRGLLSVDDTVDKYLPGFAEMYVDGKSTPSRKITIRNLLTHTSGFCDEEMKKAMTEEDDRTIASAVEYYQSQALSYEPGTSQAYSGTAAFDVAARIIELVSGKAYVDFVREEIFTPCKMENLTFAPTDEQWKELITMSDRKDDKMIEAKECRMLKNGCVFCHTPVTHPLGGAGLVSDINDYKKFAEMLLNGGKVGEKAIISEEAFADMTTPVFKCGDGESWGLGVRVIDGENRLPKGCFGWSGAWGTHFWIDPENKIIAIYMKNSLYDGGSGAITAKNLELDVYGSTKI